MVEVSPSICMSSSDLKRLLASCSESDPLWEHSASTSSMKMMLGEKYLSEHLYVWSTAALCKILFYCTVLIGYCDCDKIDQNRVL